MAIQGALYRRDKSPVRLELESPASLRDTVGKGRLPAAVVIQSAELDLFREIPDVFKDRHSKDNRKPLSKLLLGLDGRIPLIGADFSSVGRLKQAIGVLLENADKAGECGIYVLGVSEAVFHQSWASALLEDSPPQLAAPETALSRLLQTLPGEAQLGRRFWGDSDAHHLVRQLILRAATISDPVLILGETGTGKGVVARAIHDLGRPNRPFVEVNCGAIPGELFESELFGYAPGAFTGALRDGKAGQWEAAKDGTLFLDEVGDLDLDHQTKILHSLQSGYIRRLGELRNITVSARVIAATNRNLFGMVQTGKFREDLYYRLRQFVIITPELRENPHDLALIAQELWREITKTAGRLPPEVLDDLCRHRWPGNVRELRSVLGSLANFFGTIDPTREQLNAVFQHFGLAAGYGKREFDTDEPGLLLVECLRKIERADAAIHACEQVMKPVADGLPLNTSVRGSLTRIRLELQSQLRNRLYFGNPEAYQSVLRVAEDLGQLLALAPTDTLAAPRYWRSTLAPDIQGAIRQLFRELQRLRELTRASALEKPTAS